MPRFLYRLHLGNAHALLDGLEAEPEQRRGQFADFTLCPVLTAHLDSMASMDALITRAAGMGIPVVPDLYVMPRGDWADPSAWKAAADVAAELVKRRAPGDMRMGFDLEFYDPSISGRKVPTVSALAGLGATVADLAAWMAPLLDVVSREGVLPSIYPAAVNNEALDLIIQAAGGRALLWDENSFEASHMRRVDPYHAPIFEQRCSVSRAKMRARWPLTSVRGFLHDDHVRTWGRPFQAEVCEAIDTDAPMLFDYMRVDSKYLGRKAWETGTAASPLNGLLHCWPASPMVRGAVTSVPGGVPLQPWAPSGVPRSLGEGRMGGLYLDPANGQPWMALRAYPWLKDHAGPFTVDVTLGLPRDIANGAPLLSACQANNESWQAVYRDEMVVLQVRQGAGIAELPVAPVKPGTDARFQVGRNGKTWMHGAARSTLALDPPKPSALFIGQGTEMGTYKLRGCPGLIVKGSTQVWESLLEESLRQQAVTGIAPMTAKYYPYGRPV